MSNLWGWTFVEIFFHCLMFHNHQICVKGRLPMPSRCVAGWLQRGHGFGLPPLPHGLWNMCVTLILKAAFKPIEAKRALRCPASVRKRWSYIKQCFLVSFRFPNKAAQNHEKGLSQKECVRAPMTSGTNEKVSWWTRSSALRRTNAIFWGVAFTGHGCPGAVTLNKSHADSRGKKHVKTSRQAKQTKHI